MRRLSPLFLVLCLSPLLHAGLSISVNGVIHSPLDEVLLQTGETAVIGIHGDGTLVNIAPYLLVEGPGSIEGHTMVYPGSLTDYQDLEAHADSAGMSPGDLLVMVRDLTGRPDIQDISFMTLADELIPPASTVGLLVDNIIFQCGGFGDVTLTLVYEDPWTAYPTQIVHQIPEPATFFLLGLGGLILAGRGRRCA